MGNDFKNCSHKANQNHEDRFRWLTSFMEICERESCVVQCMTQGFSVYGVFLIPAANKLTESF